MVALSPAGYISPQRQKPPGLLLLDAHGALCFRSWCGVQASLLTEGSFHSYVVSSACYLWEQCWPLLYLLQVVFSCLFWVAVPFFFFLISILVLGGGKRQILLLCCHLSLLLKYFYRLSKILSLSSLKANTLSIPICFGIIFRSCKNMS